MAKLTGDIIKAGLHVWAVGYQRGVGSVPVELILVSGVEHTEMSGAEVVYACLADPLNGIKYLSSDPNTGLLASYLGDDGIRPYNYDNRATQVFTTREELVAAMQLWNGRNPNFVDEEGNDIGRDYCLDYDEYA